MTQQCDLNRLRVGFALTGSFCTLKDVLAQMRKLAESGATVFPIMSEAVYSTDTRFFGADELKKEVCVITGNKIIYNIVGAEPLGPKSLLDVLIVAPCTSNTLNKIANGINDTPVTMAVKSVLRNNIPVVLAISTNDGLAASAVSIGILLNRKNIYFVPFKQDDPINKQRSLVAEADLIIPTLLSATEGRQLQPILV